MGIHHNVERGRYMRFSLCRPPLGDRGCWAAHVLASLLVTLHIHAMILVAGSLYGWHQQKDLVKFRVVGLDTGRRGR